MSELVSRHKQDMGSLMQVEEMYREAPGKLANAYVEACTIVIDDYTARKLVKAGSAGGWRFRLLEDDFVDMWAPSTGEKPVTYKLRNSTLWRAVKACGKDLILQEA